MDTYLNTLFKNPKEIYIGRNMKNAHYFLFIVLIALVLSAISLFEFIPAVRKVQTDFEEIGQSLPNFKIVNNELISEEKSYIYQTDSMIFYFDPDNHVNKQLIDNNMDNLSTPVSTALLKDEIYISFLNQGYNIKYSEINNFTAETFKAIFTRFEFFSYGHWLIFILLIILFRLFSYIYQLLLLSLIANIVAIFSGTRLKFVQTMKITMLANIIPIIGLNIITLFFGPIAYQFETVLIMTTFIFYMSIKEMKKRMQIS